MFLSVLPWQMGEAALTHRDPVHDPHHETHTRQSSTNEKITFISPGDDACG